MTQVDDLLVLEEQLDVDVRSLDTCQYAHSTFAEILNKIQKAVDDLSLHQYSNLHIWVQRLDEQVGLVITTGLSQSWRIIVVDFVGNILLICHDLSVLCHVDVM